MLGISEKTDPGLRVRLRAFRKILCSMVWAFLDFELQGLGTSLSSPKYCTPLLGRGLLQRVGVYSHGQNQLAMSVPSEV